MKKFSDCFSLENPFLAPSSRLLHLFRIRSRWFVKIVLSNEVERELGQQNFSSFVVRNHKNNSP